MDDVEMIRTIERAPMRTLRAVDVRDLVTNSARTLSRLVQRGALTKLVHGIYTVPPDGADGRHWRPPLEAGALALATARFGVRAVVLVGDGAARHWHAIPRAIGTTTIAVGERGVKPVNLATGGRVRFVFRRVESLPASLERTILGTALVATLPQTLLDLLVDRASRETLGESQHAEALANLASRVTRTQFNALLDEKQRVPSIAREFASSLAD